MQCRLHCYSVSFFKQKQSIASDSKDITSLKVQHQKWCISHSSIKVVFCLFKQQQTSCSFVLHALVLFLHALLVRYRTPCLCCVNTAKKSIINYVRTRLVKGAPSMHYTSQKQTHLVSFGSLPPPRCANKLFAVCVSQYCD